MTKGLERRAYCSQAAEYKKAPKPSQNPNVEHRDNPGMDRFECQGKLNVRIKQDQRIPSNTSVRVMMSHACKHVKYYSVSTPEEALKYIESRLNDVPSQIYSTVARKWPQVTQAQVYSAWVRLSERMWKRDDSPIISSWKFLNQSPDDVDLWDVASPEGVITLCWGVKRVAEYIKDIVVEIGMDATCKNFIIIFLSQF